MAKLNTTTITANGSGLWTSEAIALASGAKTVYMRVGGVDVVTRNLTVAASAPTWRGETAITVTNSGASSIDIPLPAGVSAGDILVAHIFNYDGVGLPAGWATLNTYNGSSDLFWKRAGAGETTPVVFGVTPDDGQGTNYISFGRMYAISGLIGTGNPVDAAVYNAIGTPNTVMTGAALTSTASGDVALMFVSVSGANRTISSVSGLLTNAVTGGGSAAGSILAGYNLDVGAAGLKSAPIITVNSTTTAPVSTIFFKKA